MIIGKFCQNAQGVKFIMNGANHDISGVSTYPFNFLQCEVEFKSINKVDTEIGNDVWIGYKATIMPGKIVL